MVGCFLWNSSAREPKFLTSTWYTTNDATFEITGVQLEVGEMFPPFEHRTLWAKNLNFARDIIKIGKIILMMLHI